MHLRTLVCAVIILASGLVSANDISCTESAFTAEVTRLNACGNYSDAGCQPPIEKCAANGETDSGATGVTCCTGENAGSCNEGRKVTFNCGETTIHVNDCLNDGSADAIIFQSWCDPSGSGPCTPNDDMCVPDSGCGGGDTSPCTNRELLCTSASTPFECCTGLDEGTCCAVTWSQSPLNCRFDRQIEADDVVIDGESNITFKMDPPYYEDDPDNLDVAVEAAMNVADVRSDNITVRNLTIVGFFEAFRVFGDDATFDNITVTHIGDDAISTSDHGTYGDPIGLLVTNSTFENGHGKCNQVDGDDEPSSGSNYHSVWTNNTFIDCQSGLQTGGGGGSGRHRFDGNLSYGTGTSGRSRHRGVTVTSGTVYASNNVFYNHWYAVLVSADIEESSFISEGGNHIYDCIYAGVVCLENSSHKSNCVLQGDTIYDNGGSTYSGREGGVSVQADAYLDMGGGSKSLDGNTVASAGGNWIYDNRSSGDPTDDLVANSTDDTHAAGVRWGFPCVTDPSGLISDDGSGTLYYLPVWCSSGLLIVN